MKRSYLDNAKWYSLIAAVASLSFACSAELLKILIIHYAGEAPDPGFYSMLNGVRAA